MRHSIDWAIELLREARSVDEVEVILRSSARAGVGADGTTVVRREGQSCYYADEDAVGPLWKGQRFPLIECISGFAMLNDEVVIIPDTDADDRIPHSAYLPTFVHSLMMVPIGHGDPVGAIGAYWADNHLATEEETGTLRSLATAAAAALDRLR